MVQRLLPLVLIGVAASSVHANAPLLRGNPKGPQNLECDRYWLKVKCDGVWGEKEDTDLKSKEEVRAANVCSTECPGKPCGWRWGGEDCREEGSEAGIQCTIPHQPNVARKGHAALCDTLGPRDVPYECEDGTKMCCTESSMTEVDFDNYGRCSKKGDYRSVADA